MVSLNTQKYRKYVQKTKSIVLQYVVILLISLCMGEIALRIYNHYFPSFIFYSESYERFRRKPFARDWNFRLNSQGYKDKEFLKKRDDVYRIIGIGDSFAFGVVPYKYNYLTLIEYKMNLSNINVEVLNMGIPSIGPKEYLSLFKNEGLELSPDMVLLSFFIGNDLFKRKIKREYYEYSFVASLFHYIINIYSRYRDNIVDEDIEYCDECAVFDTEQYLNLEFRRSSIYLVDNETLPNKIDNAVYYLDEIRKICEKNNIAFIVVIIPDELQINKDLLQNVKDIYYQNIDDDKLDMTLPNKLLSNELDKLNIDNIDLYTYFADSTQQLYRPRDTHWNIAGNKLAADVITSRILNYRTSENAASSQ